MVVHACIVFTLVVNFYRLERIQIPCKFYVNKKKKQQQPFFKFFFDYFVYESFNRKNLPFNNVPKV